MFEELLAQDVGLYDGTWRLIPIKFAELSRANLLPARLRMLSTLDLGRPGRAETDLQRLVSALNGPVPSRTAAV